MSSFSIITIVYNDVTHIKETMDSVMNQNYGEIEYILIDGGSIDGTKEAIFEHITSYATITQETIKQDSFYLEATAKLSPTFTFKFLSEKDKGIYDAMNKGIILATKEWINFMNCGDCFYNLNVLVEVANQKNEADILYGNTQISYIDQNLNIIKIAPSPIKESLKKFGVNLIHQSMFFKTQIHKHYLYNTQDYKIASDYDLIYRLYTQNYSFGVLPLIISTFHTGGCSDIYGILRTNESFKIARQYNSNVIQILLYYFFSLGKKIAKTYLPKKLLKRLLMAQK
ncbi:glycosyltransferase family 2 protein [Helicobacter cholecystus]|uniref:glycosyltransferase family 2 protein n=1 Tax=Helicobacter cholecystus TaxID=45498 RepID=UPI0027385F64|nr:glycosyltransferase family 2 protein [Helicobacter cholecystus]